MGNKDGKRRCAGDEVKEERRRAGAGARDEDEEDAVVVQWHGKFMRHAISPGPAAAYASAAYLS